MKKISLLLLSTLMAFCVFTSCSDDDDDDKKVNNSIVGTWTFKEVQTDVKTNSTENDKKAKDYIIEEEEDWAKATTFTFNENGTFVAKNTMYNDESGTYTFKDGKLIFNYTNEDGEDDFEPYNASIIDGILYMTYADYSYMEELKNYPQDAGITDPDFTITKADYKVVFKRK